MPESLVIEGRFAQEFREIMAELHEFVSTIQRPKLKDDLWPEAMKDFSDRLNKRISELREELASKKDVWMAELRTELAEKEKAFDKALFKDLSFMIPKAAIVGLIGPNGTGKTTLFRLLTGTEKPDAGTVTIGKTVSFAYVDQGRESLEGGLSLLEELAGQAQEIKLGKRSVPVRQYLSWFGFKGADQQQMSDELSGGERNRLHLAKTLKVGGNVLLLDEPSNDLDVNTLRSLEDAVLDFNGTVLVISHDRFFLDRICTHLLVFESAGQVRFFTGNYRDYEEWHTKELGGELYKNRRNRYRKIA